MARPARPVDPDSERALVLAAAQVFARDGYQAASLNEILQAAGWAKSSLYHYFSGKKGLHDRVVAALRNQLAEDLTLPNLDTLTAESFWPTMADLLDGLARASGQHPETRKLGLMYHRDDSAEPDSALQGMRADVTDWLGRAVRRGHHLGLVRQDLPVDLAVELAVAVLSVLDRWVVDHDPSSTAGTDAARLSLSLIQNLVADAPRS